MFWEEDAPAESSSLPDDIVDVAFALQGRCLPSDHANALSRAVAEALPWWAQEPRAGLHLIHVAESGNGWYRPEDPEALLYLSRRTRLTLRLPRERVAQAEDLSGRTLDIAGHALAVGGASVKPLPPSATLFARYVLAAEDQDEEAFLQQAARDLAGLGIRVRKMLCGKTRVLGLAGGRAATRSLLLADLEPAESVHLQREGLGDGRKLGCGLFIPHKGIRAVHETADKTEPGGV